MQMTGTKACNQVCCPELDEVLHSCAILEGIIGAHIYYPFHIHCSWNLGELNTVAEQQQQQKKQSQCRFFRVSGWVKIGHVINLRSQF